MQPEASSSTPPKTPNRKWRLSIGSLKLSRKRTYSGSTNSLSPSRSLLFLSPSKLWRRRRVSTSSFTSVSESSSLSTPPSTPSKSSLPVRSYTVRRSYIIHRMYYRVYLHTQTPTYKKRPRFPTKIFHRQGNSTFDDVQSPPPPQTPTWSLSPNALQSVLHSKNDMPTRRSTRTLSFDSTTPTTPVPWVTRSLSSSPSLNSSSFESPLLSAQKPVLDKDLSEDRPLDVSLWTLFVITMLGYLFFFFFFLGCFLMVILKFFRSLWSTTDE